VREPGKQAEPGIRWSPEVVPECLGRPTLDPRRNWGCCTVLTIQHRAEGDRQFIPAMVLYSSAHGSQVASRGVGVGQGSSQ
jgi:hypothetical protein